MSVRNTIILCDFSSTFLITSPSHPSQTRLSLRSSLTYHDFEISSGKNGFPCLRNSDRISRRDDRRPKRFIVYNVVQPGAPPPSGPPFDVLKWMVGVMTLVLPFFFSNKWGSLLKIKNEVDTAVETIEEIVEGVENVADGVEKVAEDIAKDLPEGGRLRKAIDFVEHVAESASKDAHLVDDFIDKVQEAEEKVEEYVESMWEEVSHGHPKQENDGSHGPAQRP